jgi:aspartate carbamoyltransferase catalytic subunit
MSYNPPPNPNLKKPSTPSVPKSTSVYVQGQPIPADQLLPIHGKRDFKLASFVSVEQLNVLGMDHIMTRAGNIKSNPIKYNKLAKGKLMYSLFFSNSTRTRFSTETAWTKLGGTVISLEGTDSTSIAKGESIDHTFNMFTGYEPDFIALRAPIEYLPQYMAVKHPDITWINCGDGSNEHPTQAMLDLFTIKEKFEDLSKVKIAFVGDIKYQRTIKSFVKVLVKFGVQMVFVAPSTLHAKEELEAFGVEYIAKDISELSEVVQTVDVVYSGRPQLERMSLEDRELYKDGTHQINLAVMGSSKALIMHALPINSAFPDIHTELDSDPRSIYFEQAANGLWARMAIMSLLMGI